jgi:hypothetical protein
VTAQVKTVTARAPGQPVVRLKRIPVRDLRRVASVFVFRIPNGTSDWHLR